MWLLIVGFVVYDVFEDVAQPLHLAMSDAIEVAPLIWLGNLSQLDALRSDLACSAAFNTEGTPDSLLLGML